LAASTPWTILDRPVYGHLIGFGADRALAEGRVVEIELR